MTSSNRSESNRSERPGGKVDRAGRRILRCASRDGARWEAVQSPVGAFVDGGGICYYLRLVESSSQIEGQPTEPKRSVALSEACAEAAGRIGLRRRTGR